MRYLQHDSGGSAILKNAQVLGDESPLEFDDEGRAGPLEDRLAAKVSAMDRHVTLGKRARPAATCETVKSDGDVCGRDLPCPYHTED